MNNETTNEATETPTQSNHTSGVTGTAVVMGVLKLAGLALAAYRVASHHKQEQQAAALSASVAREAERASMASVDKNVLMNMAMQHMRNMNRPMMK